MKPILRSIVAVLTLASAGAAVAGESTTAADTSSPKKESRCDDRAYDLNITMMLVDGACVPVATAGGGYDTTRDQASGEHARRSLGFQEERFLRETWAALP